MLANYWPVATQVNACIKNEAETADVAVLLAVHQPSPLTTRDVGSDHLEVVTEQDLLNAFLTDDVPGGALLVPITGASGAGKSHMIRWLDAQLQRSAKSDRLHIIRIPKSASLRTVVEKILEPLKDNPAYDKARKELTRAVAAVNLDEAVLTFRAHLEFALKEIGARLQAEYIENPERADLRPKIGHARDLPKLFGDAALADHFATNVLSRIVQRALQGRAEDNSEEDDRKSRFVPEDLALPANVELGQAAQAVKSYYQRNLDTTDAAKIRVAIDLLNDAIDPAIGNVFHLQQSTGGMTFQDIILAVRQTLLEEGKDLVLLVEDFAALSGIQDVLLKVCIQEGEYEGKKIRATMRTAIALTDGILSFRDTMFTRARKEWVVGGREMTDAQIKEATIDLVGAYLNAARYGESELRRVFREGAGGASNDWLGVWRDGADTDADQAALKAFGFSNTGAPLFPFNRLAIATMADLHLVRNKSLVFNPRKIINEILRNTLLLRRLFESNAFPSADQKGFNPNTWLAGWIAQTNQTEATRKRLQAFLPVWGGNPVDESALSHLPPKLFEAFSLPTPGQLASISYVEITGPPPGPDEETDKSQDTGPADAHASPGTDAFTTEWSATLEAWVGGEELGQSDARAIRNALLPMIERAMEWPRLRVRKRPLSATSIFIADARGNPAPRRALIVCDSSTDEDGRIRAGFLGALRHHENGKAWDYPGADDDYVSAMAIIDDLARQAELIALQDTVVQVRILAQGLLTQARIAGLSPPLKLGNVNGTLAGLFEPLPPRGEQGLDDDWEALREVAWGTMGGGAAREGLQTQLLGLMSAFQGNSGNTPFGLDSVRLLDSLAASETPDPTADPLDKDTLNYLRQLGDSRVWAALQPLIKTLRQFRSDLSPYVEGGFDKAAFVEDLKVLSGLLVSTGTWPDGPDFNMKAFENKVKVFDRTPILDLVEKATVVDEAKPEQLAKVLNALGSLDLSNIDGIRSFLSSAEAIVSAAQIKVDNKYAASDQANPDRIADEIDELLGGIIGAPSASSGEAA
ncbi:MAG: hypothetical protein JWR84_1715 [Caulobacter sp.]|nr:hypothetical protein [Caulobacter sp.]